MDAPPSRRLASSNGNLSERLMVTLGFIAASTALLLTPGPTNTILAACGASGGFRRAAILPLAEALGYAVAIAFFVACAGLVRADPAAFALVKLLAAGWLAYSAYRLWVEPFPSVSTSGRSSFSRVLLTTMVNPKAMLVGTILIPSEVGIAALVWIGTYVVLSIAAGMGWVMLGALLPQGIRRHAYKAAAVVLGGFSIAAVASVASL